MAEIMRRSKSHGLEIAPFVFGLPGVFAQPIDRRAVERAHLDAFVARQDYDAVAVHDECIRPVDPVRELGDVDLYSDCADELTLSYDRRREEKSGHIGDPSHRVLPALGTGLRLLKIFAIGEMTSDQSDIRVKVACSNAVPACVHHKDQVRSELTIHE